MSNERIENNSVNKINGTRGEGITLGIHAVPDLVFTGRQLATD